MKNAALRRLLRTILLLPAALTLCAFSTLNARADVIPFQASGLFPGHTLFGNITINTDSSGPGAGTVLAGSLELSGFTGFVLTTQGQVGSTVELDFANNMGALVTLFLPVSSLVGYTGGSICSASQSCENLSTDPSGAILTVGSLTEVSVPAPAVGAGLPGLMAGAALLGWWRRKRKDEAAA